jgi:hypothetical protein
MNEDEGRAVADDPVADGRSLQGGAMVCSVEDTRSDWPNRPPLGLPDGDQPSRAGAVV